MKKFYLKLAAAALCLSWSLSGMAEITATSDYMYIESFQIKPGDTKLVDVWMQSSIPWMHLQGEIVLPEGLTLEALSPEEINAESYIYDKEKFGEYAALSTNFTNRELMSGPWAGDYNPDKQKTSHLLYTELNGNKLTFVVYSLQKINIMGDGEYQLFQLKLHAEEGFMGGNIEMCPGGFKFINYEGFSVYEGGTTDVEVEYSGQPYFIKVTLPPVGIEDVKAASTGESRYYDLQGRALKGEPATPGIYVKDGKTVLVK